MSRASTARGSPTGSDSRSDRQGPDAPAAHRLALSDEAPEQGLVALVLTLVELLRQLTERQAVRRVDDGDLDAEQVERLGTALLALDERMDQLCAHFGLTRSQLNLDLGPLGQLLPER